MTALFDRLRAVLANRYVLEGEAGAGGMAVVFRARDVRHNRTVAVKVVRPELAGALGVDRFLREIELAAGLQHPNILPVFDSGAVDEGTAIAVPWLVMPFVEEVQTYLVPLTYLALGRTWEAAGQRDSALYAYGKFVRLWDKADPPLQDRVRDAREAMARLSAEPKAN